MKLKQGFRTGAFGLLLAAVGGCYDYPPPPTATMGETYTLRKQDGSDRLLENITNLSLAKAQRIAVRNNPTYIAAYHSVNAARMKYLQALGAYSPTVTANFSLADNQNWVRQTKNLSYQGAPTRSEAITSSTGITANWLVFDGLSREFSVKIYQHNFNYEKRLEEDEARTLMRAVAYAYNQVLLAIENKRIAQSDLEFQQSSLRDTRLKYEAGTVPLSDVLNFQITANSAESDKITADYDYEIAVYALAVLMGYPEGTLPKRIQFPSDFKSNFSELPSVDIYLDTALANRPDLKGYREQLEIAKYQMYQTWSDYSPTVNAYVQSSYGTTLNRYGGWHGEAHDATHTYSESPSFGYGLTADWTIFNGLIRENKIREYKANVAVAEFNVASQWLTVVSEVRTAYANYAQSVRQTRLYRQTRDLSAQQRDLVDEGYKAGNTELTRLNEAQNDLVQAETNLASSYINIQNAKAQLDAAVGVNPAAFYADPDNVAPGILQNTPIPNSEKQETVPAKAPVKEGFLPNAPALNMKQAQADAGVAAAPVSVQPAAKSSTPAPAQPAPVIPTDPAKAPAKK